MAVENKFKLNVIAASVLMGLSLSAVAAGANPDASGKTEAAGTEVKVLSDLATPVDAKNIDVTVTGVSDGSPVTLDKLADKDTKGSVAATKSVYDAAQDGYKKLNDSDLKLISSYNDAAVKKNTATQTWDAFGNKVAVANNLYSQRLSDLYGTDSNGKANDAFTVDDESKITSSASDTSAYGKYLSAYNTLQKDVEALNDAITKNDGNALNAFQSTDGDVQAAVRKAEASVIAYSNYINKYIDAKKAELQLNSVRDIVTEHIPDILKAADRVAEAHTTPDAEKTNLQSELTSLKTAFTEWQSATPENKVAKEGVLANTFKRVVENSAVSQQLPNTGVQGGWGDVASAWSSAVTVVSNANVVLATAADFGDSGGAIIAIKNAQLTNILGHEKKNLGLDSPKNLADALSGLKNAYGVLIDNATTTEKTNLSNAIQSAQEAHTALSGLQSEYLDKVNALKLAGDARLNLLLSDLPAQQQAFYAAQDNFIKVQNEYNKSGAKNAVEVLYGSDGTTGALGEYKTALKNASAGIDTLLGKGENSLIAAYQQALSSAKTQAEKNTALYKLIGQQKTLTPEKLKLDQEYLSLLQEAPAGVSTSLAALKADLKTAADNKAQAEADYTGAVKDYLAAEKAYQTSGSQADIEKLNAAQAHLMTVVGISDPAKISSLYVDSGHPEQGFKQFDKLTANDSDVISQYTTALDALSGKEGTPTDIQTARTAVVKGMNNLASLMPFATAEEQTEYRNEYNNSLKLVGVAADDAVTQSKAPGAGKVTHILGSLNNSEIAQFDPISGNYKSVIVNVDDKGNITGVKDNFTAKDLYTGTKDKPFTTTVLDIRALELDNGALADTNTITVGEAGSKATPVEVWAKTAGVKHSGDESSSYVSAEHGPAVKLSENLRTATAQLDENGKPVEGQVVRGADQIHLQNVNIHNSFTLADRVQMLKDDMAALNQQAADKLALGQPADGEKGVNAWLKGQTDLLNSKYDNLGLTGLQIDTTTVNPVFNVDSGAWTTADKTAIPTEANILLDNLNITLQNDSVGGISTAIDLSGTGNHILASGGVFDAGKADNLAHAYVLNITGTNNLIYFNSSVLNGDISSGATGNTVNLTNGSLTGNVTAGDDFSLNLDNSVWTGTGLITNQNQNYTDVSLSNNAVWNVAGNSAVNSLALNGNNTLNLVDTDGMAQLGGHGFAGAKSAATLTVNNDLTSDGKGVTSVLAGTYSPDSLHSLTNTGLSDNYQFGTLHVDGLATGGKYAVSLESSGAEPYTIGGRLADGPDATGAHDFVSYKTSEVRTGVDKDGKPVTQEVKSDADFTSQSAPAELGVYQYAAEKVMDGVNNRTNIYYSSTGKLSNGAATAVSLAAAPVDVVNLESDTLAKHMNSVRHGKDSGVWVSYFGGENRNTTASGPEYKLNTSGVMLGADTLTENNWLAGVAVSSARSDMSVMNSSGDLDSYGAQFYMSRRYDSGVFVDSALQFNHFSNTAKARMTDGQQAKADFSGNSYGLEAKVGYAWNSEGFFAEPYVRAAARAFDGGHYALSNGMTVNSNDYKSMLGEVGADLGYQYAISGGYVKPYLHLAALNEFADGNSVRVNNVSLDDSVKGAAFQAGLGAEVKVTDNLGGYAAFDYTKGDNTERPWQATVGVNYTW